MESEVADIFSYLESLPDESIHYLYDTSQGDHAIWACQAVLQTLPPLAKQYVMRLLAVGSSGEWIPEKALQSWIQDRYISSHETALNQLRRLRVVERARRELGGVAAAAGAGAGARQRACRLTPAFAGGLRAALAGGGGGGGAGAPWEEGAGAGAGAGGRPVAPAALREHAGAAWARVLHFLVGSDQLADPPAAVVCFLLEAGLMKSMKDEDGEECMSITNTGYEFMLKGINTQVWLAVRAYLDLKGRAHRPPAAPPAAAAGADSAAAAPRRWAPGPREAALALLLQLAYCPPGRDCPAAALSPAQQEVLGDFANFGLIYRRKPTSARFYPTPLGINLIFGEDAEVAGAAAEAAAGPTGGGGGGGAAPDGGVAASDASMLLIVQTNYQVTAYTSSSLHAAMLSLFVELRLRLRNVVVGAITRDSARRAFDTGISARQVLAFLRAHAHPAQRRRGRSSGGGGGPVVPENVADQLLLWEREKTRIRYEPALVLELRSASAEGFEHALEAALGQGAALWASREKRKLAVAASQWDSSLQKKIKILVANNPARTASAVDDEL